MLILMNSNFEILVTDTNLGGYRGKMTFRNRLNILKFKTLEF